jgi:hypothetical protein
MQRDHTAKANVDGLEVLHDERIELYFGLIIATEQVRIKVGNTDFSISQITELPYLQTNVATT